MSEAITCQYSEENKELTIQVPNGLLVEVMGALYNSPYYFKTATVKMSLSNTSEVEVIIPGSKRDAIQAARTLYKEELMECEHEFTEYVGTDDSIWMGPDGELHQKSNPDVEHCLVCGKFYNQDAEEWE